MNAEFLGATVRCPRPGWRIWIPISSKLRGKACGTPPKKESRPIFVHMTLFFSSILNANVLLPPPRSAHTFAYMFLMISWRLWNASKNREENGLTATSIEVVGTSCSYFCSFFCAPHLPTICLKRSPRMCFDRVANRTVQSTA